MKLKILFPQITSGIVMALLVTASAQAGILDLLRGEKKTPEFQRVAFVGTAQIKDVRGVAERLRGIDKWQRVRQGERLAPGDMIRTQDGMVVLRMTESGSLIKVTPHTILRLVSMEPGWERAVLSGQEEQNGFVVRSCRGIATYSSDGANWERVRVNSVLPAGVLLRTDKRSTVDLFHTAELRALRVEPDSTFTLGATVLASSDSASALAAGGGR